MCDVRMRVAKTADRDATAQVEITPPGNVIKVTARAVAQRDLKARVARNDVFLKQGLNGRQVVADNGRRRRNDFFHDRIQSARKNDSLGARRQSNRTSRSGVWE